MLASARRNLFRSAAIARVLALGTAALAGSPAAAQDVSTGSGSTDIVSWFDSTSWADGSAPTAADDVVINAPSGVEVAGAAASSRAVDVGSNGDGLLVIGPGGTLTSSTSSEGSQSRLGVLTGDRGDGTVAGAWTLDHALVVGAGGTGSLGISEGGQVGSITGLIGDEASATGTVTINGSGSHWQTRDKLTVGAEGHGTLTLQDGGTVTSNEGALGDTVGGVGTASVTGAGSSWNMAGDLYVGHNGSGTLTIDDHGAVSSLRGVIGYFAESTGTVTVTGPDSHWTMSDNLQVGRAGTGELHISAGATVRSRYGAIGAEIGDAVGTTEVTGSGSTLTVDELLYVGRFGSGDLRIGDGGAVHSASGVIAEATDATGTVIIDGDSSHWDIGGELIVVNRGAGALVLRNGGTVKAGDLALALSGSGTLTIGAAPGEAAVAPGLVDAPTIAFGSGNGTINFNHTQDGYRFAPVISGTGAVNALAGRTILTGANDYTGITTIADGATLQIGDGGTEGRIASTVRLDGGTLAFARADEFAFGGDISGTGNVTQAGGTLVLSGGSSFAGKVTVTGGTLRVATPDALGAGGNTLVLGGGGMLQAGASLTMAQNLEAASPNSNSIDTNGFDLTLSGVIADGAGTNSGNYLNKLGTGMLTLTGANTYTNRTLLASGTLALAGDGTIGRGELIMAPGTIFDISQAKVGARVIQLNDNGPTGGTIAIGSKTLTLGFPFSTTDWTGTITDGGIGGGTGGRLVIDAPRGTVRLREAQGYTGGTTVASGTLELAGSGALSTGGAVNVASGALLQISGINRPDMAIGDLAGGGTVSLGDKALTFGTSNDTLFSGAIVGSGGSLIKQGSGTFTLTGNGGHTGTTTVAAGALRVDGTLGGSATVVNAGATLGGRGAIAGDVTVADGATLAPGASAGTLRVGSLTLANASQLDFELGRAGVVGGGVNDLVVVNGNLVLDGVLNVTDIGGFGPGIYRLFDYAGTLTDHGLDFGTLPTGADAGDFFIQTRIGGQVNLISSLGATLGFWDGNDPALQDDGAIQGGDGVWNAANRNWTKDDGAVNGRWSQDFAIFGGTAGTVAVDNADGPVTFAGIQFATDGYVIEGDPLTTTTAQTIIRADTGVRATIRAAITGTGGLVKTDEGTLVLEGGNSYTGGTTLAGGILSISSDANLGAATGSLIFDGGALQNSAAFHTGRNIVLTGSGRLITDADLRIDGGVSGAGMLTKTGAGTLTLNGIGTNTGLTTVAEGALIVGSDTAHANAVFGGSLDMRAGTRLAGYGTVGSGAGSMVTIGSGATVAPGGSIGTLTVNGDLTFAAGSIYEVEVDPAGIASDRIAVSGRAILNGGSVLHIGLDGAYPGKATYTIITAAGGVEGAFDAVTSSFAFLDPILGYTPNTVTLDLVRNDVAFCDVALTLNQCSAANGAQALESGNPIFDTVLLLDDQGARRAFDLLSGEIYASLESVLVQDSRFPRNAALDRMRVAGADADPAPGVRVWMQGLGSRGHIDGDGNARRIDHESAGFLIGLDAIAGEKVQLGVFGGYQRGDADVRAATSEADVDSYHVGLYAGTNAGQLGLRAGYAFSWHKADVTRRIAFGGFTDTTRGHFEASTAQAFGEVAYKVDLGATRIEPFAQIAGVFVDSERLRESGGPAALQVAHDHVSVGFSTLGARAEQSFSLGAVPASVRASAGWRRAFGDRLPVIAARFAASSPFLIAGTPVARDGLSADLGLSLALSDATRLDIAYGGDVAGNAALHSGRATLSWAF